MARRPAPHRQGGARARVHRRLPAGARRRGRARPRDGLRLLARPGRRAAADRGRRGGRRPRARLALRRRRRDVNWGARRRLVSRGGSLYAQVAPRRARPRPHRRLQVLPPRGARGDRPRRDRRARLRVPDRDAHTARSGGLPRGRGADHVRRPRGGPVEDERRDRRSRRCCRCPCCAGGRCAAACEPLLDYLIGWSRSPTRPSSGRPRLGGAGDRGVHGAVVQAVPGDRADPRGARARAEGRARVVALDVDVNVGAPAATASSPSRR